MELTTEQNQEVTSFGIPTCECGHCLDELMNEQDEIVITKEALHAWLQGVCPAKKAA